MKDESLLVIRLSAFGDVIHTIPAVVALRDALPETEIAWAVEPAYAELVEIVAKVRAIRVSLKQWSLARIASARRDVRGFDTAIDFQGLIKSSLIARASGATNRYGFARDVIREKPAAWFVNRPVTIDRSSHVVEWNVDLARAAVPALPESSSCREPAVPKNSGRWRDLRSWRDGSAATLSLHGVRAKRRLPALSAPRLRRRRTCASWHSCSAALASSSVPTPDRCISPQRSARRSSACTDRPIPHGMARSASSIMSSSRIRRPNRCTRSQAMM
jgi:hypothetical protein